MSKNILIIDDDKRLRELLEEYLTEKNYKIYLSDDYLSAKEILDYFIFDLIIVDRMMPTGDGINLIKVIKKYKPKTVLHLAGLSRPIEMHEKNINKSINLNIIGTANLVAACSERKIKIIYFSTSYIYPGKKALMK